MSRAVVFLLVVSLNAGITVYGMDCSFGQSSNFVEKFINSCPGPLDSSDKSYCCPDLGERKTYCCDAEEFALKAGLGIVVPVVIAVVVIILLITSCIMCLCCSCCPWYRRRHRGTVYGRPTMA